MADRAADVTRIVQGGRAKGLSDDEIRALVKRYDERTQPAATPPPDWALQPNLQQPSTPADRIDPNDVLLGRSAHAQWEYTKRHPIQTLSMLAIPAAINLGARFGPPLVQSVLSKLATPTGGAVVGAAEEGIRTKGDLKSMAVGAGSGYLLGGKAQGWFDRLSRGGVDPVAAGMSQAARPSELPPALSALMRGANYDELAAVVRPPTAKAPTPAQAMTPQQMLQQEIDWRLTDAVPINAMSRKGIIEAGESIPGLGERAAAASKAGDAAEVERLLRAIRQRQHITAKSK